MKYITHPYLLIPMLTVLIPLGVLWWYTSNTNEAAPTTAITTIPFVIADIDGVSYALEVRDTTEGRAEGLSGRESLRDQEGMLFVFDKPGLYGFWMKDMLFPIDIIWLDENKKVVHALNNVDPNTYPESFVPPVPATYVIELHANTYQAGQTINFEF